MFLLTVSFYFLENFRPARGVHQANQLIQHFFIKKAKLVFFLPCGKGIACFLVRRLERYHLFLSAKQIGLLLPRHVNQLSVRHLTEYWATTGMSVNRKNYTPPTREEMEEIFQGRVSLASFLPSCVKYLLIEIRPRYITGSSFLISCIT